MVTKILRNLCRRNDLLFGKRLDTNLLRHRIRKYLNSPDHTLSDSLRILFSTLESGFKNIRIRCRIRWMRVDGRRIRKEKVADSKISGYVLTGP